MTSRDRVEAPTHLLENAHPELKVATQAACAGAAVVLDYFNRGVEMRSKPDEAAYNLVSDADVESEKAIEAVIRDYFPDHAILGEEELDGSPDAENLWIVDPLDGTTNFAHRIPHFAVAIAHYRQGVPECSVVVNPVRDDWYWATHGWGAWHNGHRMSVNPATQLSECIVACGFYYDRGAMMEATLAAIDDFFKQQVHGIRRFGTAALDFCQVADGLFGAFFEYKLPLWDVAAGRMILEEAGGTITTGRGKPLPLRQTSILASNGQIHSACLEIVARHHPPDP